MKTDMAFAQLNSVRGRISRQQYKTIKGQIIAGDTEGAMKGLMTLLLRQKEAD